MPTWNAKKKKSLQVTGEEKREKLKYCGSHSYQLNYKYIALSE